MELNYKKLGEGSVNLIVLHGLFGLLDNWMTLGRRFSEHYTVYLVDQRNHGRSPHTADFDYDLLAQDLEGFIRQHQLDNVVVLGHSMGGKTAMQLALNNTGLIEKLIVVDIAPEAYQVHHQSILAGLNALDLKNTKSRSALDKTLSEYIPLMTTRQFLLKNLYRDENKAFAWRINLPSLTENIERIVESVDGEPYTKPSLFIRGTKSDYILEQHKDRIHQLFTDTDIIDMDAGHWVHAEKPDELFDAVCAFIG